MSKTSKELTVSQSFIWNTTGSMVYLVANWLTTVLVVVLGSDLSMSGSLAVAMSVGNIYATIVLLRARPVQVAQTYPELTTKHFVAQRLVAVIAASVFCFVYSLATVSSADWAVVACYCAFKAVDSFVDVLHGVDQIHNRLDYAAISQILRGIGVLVGFCFGLIVLRDLIAAVLLMAVISLGVVLVFDFRVTARFGSVVPEFDIQAIARLTKICFPGFIASLVCTTVVSLTRQTYGLAYGNDILGIYAAVATPTAVVQALVTYLYAPLLGPLAKSWQDNRMDEIVSTIKRVFIAVAAATVVCVLGGILLGEPVLTLIYGEQIGSHSSYLALMLVATALTGLMFFSIDLAISFGKPVYGFISTAVSLVVAVVLAKVLFSSAAFQDDANIISMVIVIAYGIGLAISTVLIARLIKGGANNRDTAAE